MWSTVLGPRGTSEMKNRGRFLITETMPMTPSIRGLLIKKNNKMANLHSEK